MSDRPTEAELVRYIEWALPVRRIKQIDTMINDQPLIADEFESLRKALALEVDLREALCDSPEIETEKRIEAVLTETVVNQIRKLDLPEWEREHGIPNDLCSCSDLYYPASNC